LLPGAALIFMALPVKEINKKSKQIRERETKRDLIAVTYYFYRV